MVREDLHVHSDFGDGRTTVRQNLEAARCAGLDRIACVDRVRRDTEWVPSFVNQVRSLGRDYRMKVLVGVETRILDRQGTLDLPDFLPGVDRVYVAGHRFPVGGRSVAPRVMRVALRNGEVTSEGVVRSLIQATARAVDHAPRPVVLAHLFSILPAMGLSEDQVDLGWLEPLVDVCLERDAWLALDERWRCPGSRIATAFAAAGVPVVYGTNARSSQVIGQYYWARTVLDAERVAA